MSRKNKVKKKLTKKVEKGKRSEKHENPFEFKFNRPKYQIVGKKQSSRQGAPGVSRKRANDSRTQLLLAEYKRFGKSNEVIDRRCGESDINLSVDDRAQQRYSILKQKLFREKSFKNASHAGKDELLTHKGECLTEVEQSERPLSSDSEEDINADTVLRGHFGGGDEGSGKELKGSRKDLIAELIARTKQQRYERQVGREELMDETERLDSRWKQLLQSTAFSHLFSNKEQPTKDAVQSVNEEVINELDKKNKTVNGNNDYDRLVNELRMENRMTAGATDRKKTDEEMATEEREALELMEMQRLDRMRPPNSTDTPIGHGQTAFQVKYDQYGQLADSEQLERPSIKLIRIENESSDEEFDTEQLLHRDENGTSDTQSQHKCAVSGQQLQSVPFVVDMPKTYKDFRSLLLNRDASTIGVIMGRLVKCNHPSLKEGNKKSLGRVLLYLLSFFDETTWQLHSVGDMAKVGQLLRQLDQLTASFYDLLNFNPDHGAKCVRALLNKYHKNFINEKRKWPRSNLLILLRACAYWFPASDAWHPVMTACFLLSTNVLSNAAVKSISDLYKGLLVCAILFDYVAESKRYIPEVVAYLQSSLYCSIDHPDNERPASGTFPISTSRRKMLFISQKVNMETIESVKVSKLFDKNDAVYWCSEKAKVSTISFCLSLVNKYAELYSCTMAFSIIFDPFVSLLNRLPLEQYPAKLSQTVSGLVSSLNSQICLKKELRQLQRPQKQLNMLKMMKPRIEEHFEPDRPHRNRVQATGKNAENKRLKQKYKRELKGAVRELRRDREFVAREKMKEEAVTDRERRDKTRTLIGQIRMEKTDRL